MWPMTSWSMKCASRRWWTRSMIGEASGSTSRASPCISSAISTPGTPSRMQRLVDVEVKQAHLGVGHLRERLAVDAHELQEGDERKARREHRRGVAQQLELARRRCAPSAPAGRPERREDALDQRRLEAGLANGLLERVRRRRGTGAALQVAEGEAPALAGRADLLQRVAALAHARDEPRVRDGGRRPGRRRTAGSGRASIQRRSVAGVVPTSRATCAAVGGREPRPSRTSRSRRRRDLGPAVCGRYGPLPRSTALVFVPAAPRGRRSHPLFDLVA